MKCDCLWLLVNPPLAPIGPIRISAAANYVFGSLRYAILTLAVPQLILVIVIPILKVVFPRTKYIISSGFFQMGRECTAITVIHIVTSVGR